MDISGGATSAHAWSGKGYEPGGLGGRETGIVTRGEEIIGICAPLRVALKDADGTIGVLGVSP